MIERISHSTTFILRKAFVPLYFSMMIFQMVIFLVFQTYILCLLPILILVVSWYKGILTFTKLEEVSLNMDTHEIIVNDFNKVRIYKFSEVQSVSMIKLGCIELRLKEDVVITFRPKISLLGNVSDLIEKYSRLFNPENPGQA